MLAEQRMQAPLQRARAGQHGEQFDCSRVANLQPADADVEIVRETDRDEPAGPHEVHARNWPIESAHLGGQGSHRFGQQFDQRQLGEALEDKLCRSPLLPHCAIAVAFAKPVFEQVLGYITVGRTGGLV